MPVLYGIRNCDSVKKAKACLETAGVAYRFHDFRTDGVDAALVQRFIDTLGLDAVLNQRSSTWRQLPAERKQNLSPEQAVQLLLEQPTLIKRPIYDNGRCLSAGFDPAYFQS